MDATLRSQTRLRRGEVLPLQDRDESDPARHAVELVQRGRMILDVARADLETAEGALGAFHETTWYFRNALAEARQAWDRLRAELGTRALEAALAQPPLAMLTIERAERVALTLIPIGGKTYGLERVPGTDAAPLQYRLTCLPACDSDTGAYYLCRLEDGSLHCDCAEWTYQASSDGVEDRPCKHLSALLALGWL